MNKKIYPDFTELSILLPMYKEESIKAIFDDPKGFLTNEII